MKLGVLACCLAAACTLGAAGAWAQRPPKGGDPKGGDWAVDEVVVQARPHGPRLWKLTRGGSTLYVLGTASPLPAGLDWDSLPVRRILNKSDRLILGPFTDIRIATLRASFEPPDRVLEQELPPDLNRRLDAVLAKLHQRPAQFAHYRPAWAALELERLAMRGPLRDGEPLQQLRQFAKQARVPIEYTGRYDGDDALRQLAALPDAEGVRLVAQAVDAVSFALAHADARGRAWATGDLRGIRQTEGPNPSWTALLLATKDGAASANQGDDGITATVDAALARPGVSLAVFDLNRFARRGEAIDKLRARGVTITEPDE